MRATADRGDTDGSRVGCAHHLTGGSRQRWAARPGYLGTRLKASAIPAVPPYRDPDMAEKKATLEIHLQPGAKRNEVVGLRDGVLWVRVRAPALKGQANSALLAFVAELLGVSKDAVVITRGRVSRQKVVAIRGISTENLKEKLAQALSGKQ